MLLTRHDILPSFSHLIHSIWTVESSNAIPSQELNIGVPTGRPKLLLPVVGELKIKKANNKESFVKPDIVSFAGVMDEPITLTSSENIRLIGVDFSPLLASKIFRYPMNELSNEVFTLTDLLGNDTSELQNKLYRAERLSQKIEILQTFLFNQLSPNASNAMIEFAVSHIYQCKGKISINQLCKKLGYSKRYLDAKFRETIGISPKLFASIVRFQTVYKSLLYSTRAGKDVNVYDFYFDQSHFIKDFKRFTGVTPYAYMRAKNNFAEMFYK